MTLVQGLQGHWRIRRPTAYGPLFKGNYPPTPKSHTFSVEWMPEAARQRAAPQGNVGMVSQQAGHLVFVCSSFPGATNDSIFLLEADGRRLPKEHL